SRQRQSPPRATHYARPQHLQRHQLRTPGLAPPPPPSPPPPPPGPPPRPRPFLPHRLAVPPPCPGSRNMAVFRDRPYTNFNFLVDIGTGNTDGADAGFEEVHLPDVWLDVI